MARSLGDSRQGLAPEDLLGHLEPLLQPPIQHLIDPAARDRPLLRGLFAGRRTTLRLEPFVLDFVDDGSSFLTLEMEGATYGVFCVVRRPALLNRTCAPLGDPGFDACFEADGAPRAVLAQILNPDTRAFLKEQQSCLRFEASRLVLALGGRPRSVDSVVAHLVFAATLLDRLPDAIRAGGAGQYLALGSFATHPELVVLRRESRRRARVVGLVLLAAAGLFVIVALVAALVVWRAFAS